MYQPDIPFPLLEIVSPPTEDDLPCDDGMPMETFRHKMQMDLLMDALHNKLVREQQRGFVGGNMFIYFSQLQVRNQDFRGPDVFAVVDVPYRDRKSWVVWQEGKAPDVVIELLSDSTAQRDKTEKKLIYQNQMRVPEYFWYDPFNPDDFAGFGLHLGVYEPLPFDDRGRLISRSLDLALVRWQGAYKGIEAPWLRWETLEGDLVLIDRELVEQEQQRSFQEHQRADQEQQRADQEQQRADRLAAELRKLGIDPDRVG
ncbi:MAG TPA: Uma2 family endonuclease [Thermosynechococcaceae cyanobacterium]